MVGAGWLVPATGFEPATLGLKDRCSNQAELRRLNTILPVSGHLPNFRAATEHRRSLRMPRSCNVPGLVTLHWPRRAAIATIDNMLALYDDDEEAWYYRAQLAGGAGLFGGQVSSVPFYKSLLRVNPLHPGANHELLHYYENSRRPALGWVYAEGYIKSSPGIPHPFHMQAHLATRIGRWVRGTTWRRSSRICGHMGWCFPRRRCWSESGWPPVPGHARKHSRRSRPA